MFLFLAFPGGDDLVIHRNGILTTRFRDRLVSRFRYWMRIWENWLSYFLNQLPSQKNPQFWFDLSFKTPARLESEDLKTFLLFLAENLSFLLTLLGSAFDQNWYWKELLNNEYSILFSALIVIDIQYFFQPLLLLDIQ